MSNGPACCILGVCCPPPPEGINEPQIAALAKFIAQNGGGDEVIEVDEAGVPHRMSGPRHIAEALLANFDLVPRGVGRTIVEAYRPQFERHHGTGTGSARRNFVGEAVPGGEASPNAGPEQR